MRKSCRGESLFRKLVETASDWVWEVDENCVYTYASPRSRDLIGYEPEEVIGKTPFDFMEPAEAARLCKEFASIADKREPIVLLENTLTRKDGTLVVVETSGTPIFDDAGTFQGYRGSDRDVTARKRAEDAVRYRLEFEQVVSSISAGFINLPPNRIDAGIDHALQAIGEFTGVDWCHIMMFSDDESRLDMTHEWCAPGVEPRIQNRQGLLTRNYPSFMSKIEKLEPLVIPRIEDLPPEAWREKADLEMQGLRSAVHVPMSLGNKLVGVLGLSSTRTHKTWPEDSIMLLKFVGEILVSALDRKRTGERLIDSQERYRLLVEDINDWVWEADLRPVFTYTSPRVRDIIGYEPEGVLGRSPYDFMLPEEAQTVRGALQPLVESGKPIPTVNVNLVHKDGRIVTVQISGAPVFDDQSVCHGHRGMARDITEQVHAEAELRESEERYRRLVDLSPDGIMVTVHGTAVFVNAAALAMYGASEPEDIVGKPTLDTITPEYREIARARMMSMVEGTAQSVPPLEEKFLRMDGSKFDVEVAASRITYQGEPAILAVIRDTTERKRSQEALRESEERYRNLVETTETGYLIVDGQGRVLDANAEYVRLTGRRSLDEILGRSVLEWTAEYDLERNAEEVRKCSETGVVRNLEIDYMWPDGAIVPIEISATVIETREGPRILTLCRDITERRRAEEDQRRFEKQVEDQKRQFYRQTILSVTGGKLAISDPSEVAAYTADAELSLDVLDASQVSPARREIERFCAKRGLSGEQLDLFALAVGEAVTNAVKHGCRGIIQAGQRDGALWAAISDEGTGIESLAIPSAVLRRGYSTKRSLGLGYTIILEVADSVLLKTDREGTTVVLVKNLETPVLEVTLDQFPDTWESVPA